MIAKSVTDSNSFLRTVAARRWAGLGLGERRRRAAVLALLTGTTSAASSSPSPKYEAKMPKRPCTHCISSPTPASMGFAGAPPMSVNSTCERHVCMRVCGVEHVYTYEYVSVAHAPCCFIVRLAS